MKYRIFFVALMTAGLTVPSAIADDRPVPQTVRVKLESQPEYILNGGPKGEPLRTNIDSVETAAPPEIRAAVEDWTGIDDRGKSITVKFYHTPVNSRYVAMSFGDGFSKTASVNLGGKTVLDHETHVRYKEALAASDETTFSVLGVYEFDNRATGRKCYVMCHIEGRKPEPMDGDDGVIHPTGTATWTGPILNASTDLFAEPEGEAEE